MKLDADRLVELVAKTEMSVLLLGETGSGKGYAAEQIHRKSKRAAGPWLHLNCAALPAHLLEAELFGYERGAFTGANQAKEGLLEAAAGGTVFLDEVGELPLPVQAKLLIALEHRAVMRLGALKARPIDVRFIAATNAAIDEARGSETFRRDLYYRLAGMPITVPPLRARKAEIPALVAKFLSEGSQRLNRAEPVLTKDALARLTNYAWPGNIRELGMVIERALLWAGDTLEAHHLNIGLGSEPTPEPPAPRADAPTTSPSALERPLQDDLREVEKKRILAALDQCSGNQSRAASMLGIARGTLISRMNEFGLPRPRKG
jgi:transcriptional regulator with PAS, ATPase and Fis domain